MPLFIDNKETSCYLCSQHVVTSIHRNIVIKFVTDMLKCEIFRYTNVLKMTKPLQEHAFASCPTAVFCLMFCICMFVMVYWFMHAPSWLALIYLIIACSDKLNHGLFPLALGLFRECESAVVILFTAPSCLFFIISSSLSSLLCSCDHSHTTTFVWTFIHQSNY